MSDDNNLPVEIRSARRLIEALRSFLTITQGMAITPAPHAPAPAAVFGIRDAVVGSLAIYDAFMEDGFAYEDEPPKVAGEHRIRALQEQYGEVFGAKIEKLVDENNELSRKLREAQQELKDRPTQFIHVEPGISSEKYLHYRNLLDAAIQLAKNMGAWEPKTKLASDALSMLTDEARWLHYNGEHDGLKP